MVKDERQGWALYAAMSVIFLALVGFLLLGGRFGQSGTSRRLGSTPVNPGRQGGPLRHRQFEPMGSGDHGRLQRLGQCHAYSFTPLGGMMALIMMQLGEIIYRRRRLGSLRHADDGNRRRIRGRADGRPHAGISRQEDRGEGGQDGHARHPDPASVDAGLHSRLGGAPVRRVQHGQCRPARLQRGALSLHLEHRQ